MNALRLSVLTLIVLAPLGASAEIPMPLYPDCGVGGACPGDYDPNSEWHLSSIMPPGLSAVVPEDQQAMGAGLWVDRAWSITTGRTDVLIAGFDSGVDWDNGDLLNKWFLNTGEMPAPDGYPQDASGAHRNTWDFNGDGVFNMADWAEDARITIDLAQSPNGRNGNVKDPSDLIAFFSDGVDDDGNGYIDDVSGWDFFWNDNNAEDDVRHDGYSHGTKEGRWSSAEGNGAGGDIGSCPNCMFLPLRAGDGFVTDGNNFGLAAVYAVDMGALVLQCSLGTLNNSTLVMDAVDYAWAKGVTTIGSSADETAWHTNMPGGNHHTVYVSAIRHARSNPETSETFLANSNCTNHGARMDISIPGEGCASAATGLSAGVVGLIYSAMKDALEAGSLTEPLTAGEVYQLMTHAVDDIQHNPNDDIATEYPSYPGWDAYFGYGRLNAFTAVQAVADGNIPPEADLLSPGWFQWVDPDGGTLEVSGYINARRSTGYSWTLEVGGGVDPREWQQVASGDGTSATDGVLATLDPQTFPGDPDARFRDWTAWDTNVDKLHEVHKHMVTMRLRVTDADGRLGESRKAVWVHRDPDLMTNMPRKVGPSLEVSPTLADVNGDGIDDIVTISSDGEISVWTGEGELVPGWPTSFPLLREHDGAFTDNHLDSPGYANGDVSATQSHGALSAPAVADLDGDGSAEVVAASLKGSLAVYHADGTMADGWPFWLDRGLVFGMGDSNNAYDYGFFGAPALADMDGDGDLEIIIGAMDAWVYVFHHDGTMLDGWPVELRHEYEFFDEMVSAGARIISSPAVGDIDGDGLPEIAIGTNQKQGGTYGLGYVLSHDGQIEPGWPISAFGAYTNALPFVGEGIPGSPAICDVNGDGKMEVAMHTIADPGRLYTYDGQEYARLDSIGPKFGVDSNTSEQAASIIMIVSGAFGDVNQDGTPDYAIGGSGFEYAAGLLDDGRRHDHDHLMGVWSGIPYEDAGNQRLGYLPAFPRILEDLQFFLNPGIADIDGDGNPEVIQGSAGTLIHAFDQFGAEPEGWPKHAGGWVLGSTAVGDANGDGYLDVWTGTRDGYLFGWSTTAPADTSYRAWVGFRNDPRHTGNCHTELKTYAGPPPDAPPIEEPGCAGCSSSVAGPDRGLGLLLLALFGLGLSRRGARSGRD
jgi:hypothetical protein